MIWRCLQCGERRDDADPAADCAAGEERGPANGTGPHDFRAAYEVAVVAIAGGLSMTPDGEAQVYGHGLVETVAAIADEGAWLHVVLTNLALAAAPVPGRVMTRVLWGPMRFDRRARDVTVGGDALVRAVRMTAREGDRVRVKIVRVEFMEGAHAVATH